MRRLIGFSCLAAGALALGGCGVQLQDETPGTFTANPDIGMYPLTVKVTSGALVSTPIYVFVVGDGGQQVPLSAGANGTYGTMYPVKCKQSFPLQYLAVWRVQGVVTKHQLFPPQARDIQLTPPPLTQQASIDTSGTPDKKTHSWQGAVQYNIVTAASGHITGAQLQPVSQDKADVKAAAAVSVVSTFPVDATCGTPTAVTLATKAQTAHVNLVITTDVPGIPQATTRVDFGPQQPQQ
ncbi:MAG TPA: hypothetical protein VHY36_11210 [Steroidobacteraceae bacterium]|jgi:hypothetical protein|nr:hypothetical protein [Steroidobacteraceae bacterium]